MGGEGQSRTSPGVARAALDELVDRDWPGNIRELQNEIERAVALAHDGEAVGLEHLSGPRDAAPGAAPAAANDTHHAEEAPASGKDAAPRSLRRARAAFEARHIAETLQEHGGNVSHAAQALGLSRVMLQKKMKEYRLR